MSALQQQSLTRPAARLGAEPLDITGWLHPQGSIGKEDQREEIGHGNKHQLALIVRFLIPVGYDLDLFSSRSANTPRQGLYQKNVMELGVCYGYVTRLWSVQRL